MYMSLPPLPPRPQDNYINDNNDEVSEEEFNKRETYIKEYYLASNPQRITPFKFLRQISGPGYINELGDYSTVDWTNMWIADYRRLQEFSDKTSQDFKYVLDNIVSFVMHYRSESKVERLPERLYKKYINMLFEAF